MVVGALALHPPFKPPNTSSSPRILLSLSIASDSDARRNTNASQSNSPSYPNADKSLAALALGELMTDGSPKQSVTAFYDVRIRVRDGRR